jgi:hypothetical protein
LKFQKLAIIGIKTTKEKNRLVVRKTVNNLEFDVKSVSFTKGSFIKKLCIILNSDCILFRVFEKTGAAIS